MKRALLLLAAACSAACAAPFRGGYARSEAPIPRSQTVARLIPGHCEDPSHAEHAPRFSAVDIVQTETGRTVLLEHRQGHELLVVENVRNDGAFWVFEVIVKGDHVRRFRIPRSPHGVGSLNVGRLLTLHAEGEHFEAGLASSHLTCSLVPKASNLPVSQ